MRNTIYILLSLCIFSCNQSTDKTRVLQQRIDSLEANAYKPGFGEFMSSIQVHHAKLWFAGENQNWKLAGFEVSEIKESLEDISKYCKERPETKSIGMLNQSIENVNNAIQQKNGTLFKDNFIILTNTCNNCHRATEHEFNVIKIPETIPYSNQEFKIK